MSETVVIRLCSDIQYVKPEKLHYLANFLRNINGRDPASMGCDLNV